jgi:isopentenyl-diphosphate Delta-isomerase
MERVVLVDQDDQKLGLMDKLEAHENGGRLHRAVSVLLYRTTAAGKEVLLQRRSRKKPLWPLYWSNTVCTHPRDGEDPIACAERRLGEELGISIPASRLRKLYRFAYQARYDEQFSEHELDVVIVGEYSGSARSQPEEVAGVRWLAWRDLVRQVGQHPEEYTPWFRMIIERDEVRQIFQEGDAR